MQNESEFKTTDISNLTKVLSVFINPLLERVISDYTISTKMEWFSFVKASQPIWPELFVILRDIAKHKMQPIMKSVKISISVISNIQKHELIKN